MSSSPAPVSWAAAGELLVGLAGFAWDLWPAIWPWLLGFALVYAAALLVAILWGGFCRFGR